VSRLTTGEIKHGVLSLLDSHQPDGALGQQLRDEHSFDRGLWVKVSAEFRNGLIKE